MNSEGFFTTSLMRRSSRYSSWSSLRKRRMAVPRPSELEGSWVLNGHGKGSEISKPCEHIISNRRMPRQRKPHGPQHSHGKAPSRRRFPHVLLVVVVLGYDLHSVGDQVCRIESDTKLTNHGNIGARL